MYQMTEPHIERAECATCQHYDIKDRCVCALNSSCRVIHMGDQYGACKMLPNRRPHYATKAGTISGCCYKRWVDLP